MHGSVLQNEKYIKFSEENTVEVLALGRLDDGISKNDPKAEKYKGKDENGQDVELMVAWPNLTAEQISALNGSKAGTYNNTGRIPYTSIVNPHTLEEITNFKGGTGAGSIMEAVTEAKKALVKEHGPSLSRKDLGIVKEADAIIRKSLEKGDVVKALSDYSALSKKFERAGPALKEKIAAIEAPVLAAAGTQLDELEAGDLKANAAKIDRLARALKGTSLEQRAAELLSRSKQA